MSDVSLSVDSDDEIPIWLHGEQRWISGITNETTCAQLVEALLRNEGLNGEAASSTSFGPTAENQYVITERWRRVEQSLDNKTKILKIWKAWGQTKSEVSHMTLVDEKYFCLFLAFYADVPHVRIKCEMIELQFSTRCQNITNNTKEC